MINRAEQTAENWVEEELKYLKLGDKRLEKRAKKLLKDFSTNPTGSIAEFCGDWASTKAAYEFYKNRQAEPNKLIKAQALATLERVRAYERVLILQDTSSFNFKSHPATSNIGPLENQYCRGFLSHSSFVVSPEGLPLGLLAQQSWSRDEAEEGQRQPRHHRPITEKESYKWLQAMQASTALLPESIQAVVVSDRESDIFEYFVAPRRANVDLLVRASWNRVLQDETDNLWATVGSSPVRGKLEVAVSRKTDQAPRTAECQVYYKQVSLRPPRNRPPQTPPLKPVKLWAILVREIHPPDGVVALEWLLLTSLNIANFEQACEIILFYTRRWLIERFHFVLKSGCALEERQLSDGQNLMTFLALANILAWRLLWQTYLGRIDPDLPCTTVLAEVEWKALYAFIHKTQILPNHPPSLAQATAWIAQLGGFLGRTRDGFPGVKVLWRGWTRLADITQTWLIFDSS